MAIEDASIVDNFEEEEKSSPSPRKVVADQVIYASRKLRRKNQHGRPTMCDFGQARFGSSTYSRDIHPYIYRAPEMQLRMPWNEGVDIWNVGVLVCIYIFWNRLVIKLLREVPLLKMGTDMGSLPTRTSVLLSGFE